MQNQVADLRKMYNSFRRNEEDPQAVKSKAVAVLEKAVERGDQQTLEEVKDMLIDLEFSISENRCKCQLKCSSC